MVTDQATFQLRVTDGTAIVTVSGEIDIANVDQFKTNILDAARSANGPIIVSLERLSYADSHTLEALVSMSKRLRTNRRRLLVVAPAWSACGRILRVTGLELAIALFETLDDALHSAQK